jgi:hypothetical protein
VDEGTPFVAGYVVADEYNRLVGFGATPEEALGSVEEEDANSSELLVLSATARLLEETELTGPNGPTWLTVDFHGREVACLEEEIDGYLEGDEDTDECYD